MTDLELVFGNEALFKLTSTQFNQLIRTGETVTSYAPAKDYYIGNEEYPRLLLCFDSEASDYFFQFEAEKDIDIFTGNSCLANLFPKTGKIILLTGYRHPINNFLLTSDGETMTGLVIEREKFRTEQTISHDVLDETAVNTLLATGNLKGQLAACDCGEPGCSSTYIWAKDSMGLITFSILGAQLTQVSLFPFRLT
jgi:hypothetical protein